MVSKIYWSVVVLTCVFVSGNYSLANSVEPPPINPNDQCPVTCKQGEKGDTGSVGPAGKDGSMGVPGVKGDKGERGERGEVGGIGSKGEKGAKGYPGIDGSAGSMGSKGEKGEEGNCDAQCGDVKKLEAKLQALKANYTGEIAAVKQQITYLLSWVHPLGSKENPAVSCKEILERDKSAPNGAYYIKVTDTNLPGGMQKVYCIMRRYWPCPAGLTQVLKMDGSQNTFRFSSPFWTNKKMFLPDNGEKGCDFTQTKLATYWSTPFESICIRTRSRNSWYIRGQNIDIKAKSMYDLIAPCKYIKTSLGLLKWKRLIDRSSLQTTCTREGINVRTATSSVRIGIVGDEKTGCKNPDSYIGLGTEGSTCGRNPGTSCGNEAGCGAEGGDQHIQTFGYIYVY